jgi:hypothetical protein
MSPFVNHNGFHELISRVGVFVGLFQSTNLPKQYSKGINIRNQETSIASRDFGGHVSEGSGHFSRLNGVFFPCKTQIEDFDRAVCIKSNIVRLVDEQDKEHI